jgi:hypothetical protein
MLNLFQHPRNSRGDPETPDASGQGDEIVRRLATAKRKHLFFVLDPSTVPIAIGTGCYSLLEPL